MIFVYILLILILGSIFYFIFLQKKSKAPEIDLSKAINTLITIADQKLGQEKQIIQTDLSNKKTAIEDLVKRVLDELNKNQKKLETAESQRIGNFEALKESLENYKKITQELSVTTDGLKKVLSNNQLRGAFGEQIAEDLLKISGFVIGSDYTKQESSGESRPDFTLYLPDKTKINIDSKFPYSHLVEMSTTTDSQEKKRFLKLFEQDIKTKINEVTTRNYINPEENTVDFVILFIPNEMIFSFIYETYPDLWQEALAKKIVFAGPFSFTAILRMVKQAYDNFRYQKNTQSIIGHIKLFEKEFIKYNEEFEKIGAKIDGLSKQYNEVNNTRSTKLLRVIDKIRIDETSSPKELTE